MPLHVMGYNTLVLPQLLAESVGLLPGFISLCLQSKVLSTPWSEDKGLEWELRTALTLTVKWDIAA